MTNVISLPPRNQDKVVWRCGCGCITHFLRADGEMECAQCGVLAEGDTGEWRVNLPDTPAKPRETETGDVKVTDLNSSDAAIRRVLKNADTSTMVALVVLHDDGALSVWGEDLDTDERRDWFDRRIADAKAMLTPKGSNDGAGS